jgi:hypothetical protein
MDDTTATYVKLIESAGRRVEAERDYLRSELQRILDALSPIDDAEHVETVGRAVEVAKSLIFKVGG